MSAAGRPIALAIVAGTLRTLRSHPVAISALALLAGGIPAALLLGVAMAAGFGLLRVPFDTAMDRGGVAALALWAALTVVQAGATTSGALRALRGEPFALGRAVADGLRRAPAVLVVAVVTAAAVVAGTAVLVVPGAVALAMLIAAVPAAVAEAGGPLRAVGRSLDLTRGERAGVLGAVAGIAAVTAVAGLASGYALMEVSPGFALVVPPWYAFLGSLSAVATAVAYAELVARKEAPRTAELERVFE